MKDLLRRHAYCEETGTCACGRVFHDVKVEGDLATAWAAHVDSLLAPTREELLQTLTCYEGAIQRDNDESDDASAKDLEEAREALMSVLRRALARIEA